MTLRAAGLWLTLTSMPVSGAPAAGAPTLDPQAPCTAARGEDVTVDVELAVVVTPPYHTEKLQVWLPVPQSDSTQEVEGYTVSSYPMEVEARIGSEPLYGNTFAYLEFDHPQGAQIIRQDFTATVRELRWQLGDVAEVDEWPGSFGKYLATDNSVVVNDETRKLAQEIVPEPGGARGDLAKITDWIIANLSYDHTQCSLEASSEWARQQGCGHCSDYHAFAAALSRALGHPARVAYGLALVPKNSPSHCKLEVFMPQAGWVSYDISSTQKQIDAIEADEILSGERKTRYTEAARRRLNSGFRDDLWVRLSHGTDYELPFAGPRVAVVRTACVVADGEVLPDPDPANRLLREFAWMTAHRYTPSRELRDPFTGIEALAEWTR